MAEDEGERKLAAIMSADVVGYSRLMEDDERATVRTLTEYRLIFSEHIEHHKGRIVDTPGDNLLAEFPSAIEAVDAAADIQRELGRRNSQLAEHRHMDFRIGINLGDVLHKDGALFGDGVNIAARLEALAEPGGICISGTVFDYAKGKVPYGFDYFGEQEVKNIADPVRAYRVMLEGGSTPAVAKAGAGMRNALIGTAAALIVLVIGGAIVWQVTQQPEPEQTAQVASEDDPVLALPTGPSIAVLPFNNLSGDPEQEYFSDGLTEDIITGLTRFPELFVIARNSTFQYKGQAVDVREVARALGARYVIEGSVRKAGNRLRVTAQLLDATDGAHLWAETYDRDLTAADIFDVQDEIKGQVVATIADVSGVISRIGLEETRAKRTDSLDAYECVIRAKAYYTVVTSQEHATTRDCLERAVELDPNYSDAWSWLSQIYQDEFLYDFNPRPKSLDRALGAGRRAVELDPANFFAHYSLARAHFFRRELDQFFVEGDRSLELNPNNSFTVAALGLFMAYAGKWDRGVALAKKALALNPVPQGWYYFPLFHDHYRKGEYEEALAQMQKVNLPDYYVTHARLAMVYGQLGRKDEAQAAVTRLRKLKLTYLENVWDEWRKFNFPEEDIDQMIDGLRKAGLHIPDEPATTD